MKDIIRLVKQPKITEPGCSWVGFADNNSEKEAKETEQQNSETPKTKEVELIFLQFFIEVFFPDIVTEMNDSKRIQTYPKCRLKEYQYFLCLSIRVNLNLLFCKKFPGYKFDNLF